LAGKPKDAQALLDGEFKERSEKVVRALNKWKGELLSSTRASSDARIDLLTPLKRTPGAT
jgi:hypothetical protein